MFQKKLMQRPFRARTMLLEAFAAVFKPSPYSLNASISSHASTLTVTDSTPGLSRTTFLLFLRRRSNQEQREQRCD
jgi:hypothetical protein